MPISQKTQVISGHRYQIETLPFESGRPVFTLVVRAIGPVVARALDSMPLSEIRTQGLGADISGEAISAVITEAVDAIKDKDLEFLIHTFAEVTQVEAAPGKGFVELKSVMSVLLAGDYLAMCEWLVMSIDHNFGSFFRGLASKVNAQSKGTPTS